MKKLTSKNPCVLPHTKVCGLSGIFGDRKLEVAKQLPQYKCCGLRQFSILTIIGILAVVGAFLIFSGKSGITGNVIGNSNDAVTIPLSEISENAKWYEYDSNGVQVSFFAVKASDGSIKTAFDACDVCYTSRKGYRQEGNVMVCNNCGNRYPISGLGTENLRGGGCWPGYLPSKIEGENLVIKESDLAKGAYRF